MSTITYGRKWLALAIVLAVSLWAAPVVAQDYPSKPIRFIVPFPPGGGTDTVARAISQRLGERLGQQVVIDNRGGANAIIGTEMGAKAAPDGYTLTFTLPAAVAVNPGLYPKLPYAPLRDFAPVTQLNTIALLLVAHPGVQANSVRELIALAKAKPGTLNYGSGGNGSSLHLSAELFNSMAGVSIVRIPYKGGGPALTDLVAGHLHLTFSTTATAGPYLKAGKLRALAATGAQRTALFPGVPTMADAGLPGYESEQTSGLFAPAKTSPAIIGQLHRHGAAFLGQPEVREQLMTSGVEAVGSTPQQFAAKIKAEVARMGKVIRDVGIRVE